MNQQEFENFIERYEEEIRLLAECANVSVEEVEHNFRNLFVTVEAFVENAWRVTKNIIEFMQSLEFRELERKIKERRQLYKLDFSRPITRNQVIDRKPRHLIKKIIYRN